MQTISPERIERAARIYASNVDAANALGIQSASFGRLCRRLGVDTPQKRRQQEAEAQRERIQQLERMRRR